MPSPTKKKINLALQGGGAHGAFTWGVLDKFLELDVFSIDGISATSAGSMNAVVLVQGLMEGGNEAARQLLHEFWKKVSDYATLTSAMDPMQFFSAFIAQFSPYEMNPFNFHPLRDILTTILDIEKINTRSPIKLFIGATNVKTGKIRIFKAPNLSIEAILASACLPKIFQTVEIEGEYYWDGGYLGNPAIFPLIYNTESNDIVILHVVPLARDTVPKTTIEIDTRLREISFNSSLMREMRTMAFMTKLIKEEWIKPEYQDRLKQLHLHALRADRDLSHFPLESVWKPDWHFLLELKELGRAAGEKWLHEHYDAIGKKTTVNFEEWL